MCLYTLFGLFGFAFYRIQRKNVLKKAWETLEGQESIVHAFEESLAIACELGRTGHIVPFGKVVEFIPAIEAFEFILTAGENPPFKWIYIEPIHYNDIRKISRIDGKFSISLQPGIPRGELISVAVYGHNNRLGHTVGELYDTERLLGKAEQHSAGYKSYLRQTLAFKKAKTQGQHGTNTDGREYADVKVKDPGTDKYYDRNAAAFHAVEKEGKLKNNAKGEYADVTISPKGREPFTVQVYRSYVDGESQTERVYLDEITNPYEGPDQPEMLRKTAGKSFLKKYAKVHNSEAAMEEMRGTPENEVEAVAGRAIDAAFEVVEKDGEPEEVPMYEDEQGNWHQVKPDEKEPEPVDEAVIDAEVEELAKENGEKQGDLGI